MTELHLSCESCATNQSTLTVLAKLPSRVVRTGAYDLIQRSVVVWQALATVQAGTRNICGAVSGVRNA